MQGHKHLSVTGILAVIGWCLVIFLAVKAVGQASFGGDDAHLLQLASSLPFWHFFTNPEAYQLLSVAHFTPLVPGIYQGVLWLAGVNPAAFLVLQLLMLGLTLAGLLWLLQQRTHNGLVLWVFCLALAALGSLPSLLLRNYTQHYVLGGLFAVVCLLALHHRWLVISLLSFLLAILSKEIYLPLFGVVVLYALYKRNFSLLGWIAVVLVGYFAFRGWHLGGMFEGRKEGGLLTNLLAIQASQWQAFARWYVNHHAGLLLLALLALAFSPLRFLFYTGLAAFFLTPLLAAPHAILQPEFHADRLLYPFNLGLALAIALSLGKIANAKGWFQRGYLSRSRFMLVLPLLMVVLLLRLVFLPPSFPVFEAQERHQVQLLLNQLDKTFAKAAVQKTFIQESSALQKTMTLLVPPEFKMGALINAYAAFEPKAFQSLPLALTMNCFTVLQQTGDHLPVAEFWQPHLHAAMQGEDEGKLGQGWVARQRLEEECQPLANGADFLQIIKPITFATDGSLSWQATLAKPVEGQVLRAGIYFTKRGLFIGTLGFNERLARPFPNEPYVWVVNLGKQWWFSVPLHVVFE